MANAIIEPLSMFFKDLSSSDIQQRCFLVPTTMANHFLKPHLNPNHRALLDADDDTETHFFLPVVDEQTSQIYQFKVCSTKRQDSNGFKRYFKEGWELWVTQRDARVGDEVRFAWSIQGMTVRLYRNPPVPRKARTRRIYVDVALPPAPEDPLAAQAPEPAPEPAPAPAQAPEPAPEPAPAPAQEVLSLIGGEQTGNSSEKPTKVDRTVVEMPDLIDTGYGDLLGEVPNEIQNEKVVASKPFSSSLLIDDLFGDGTGIDLSKSELKTDDDPFADVSFHTGEDKDQGSDLFAGMTVGETSSTVEARRFGGPDPFDIFGSSEPRQTQGNQTNHVNNLMAGLSISGNGSVTHEKTAYPAVFAESIFSSLNLNPAPQGLNDSPSTGFDPQKATASANAFPIGSVPYSMPPGMLCNQFYPAAQLNYGAMNGFLAQQQFMAAMANLQSIGNMNPNNLLGSNAAGTFGADPSALPDTFNANMPGQASTVTMNAPKEETKAFF